MEKLFLGKFGVLKGEKKGENVIFDIGLSWIVS